MAKNVIKALRKANGMTQTELARLCDTTQATIARIASNTHKLSFIMASRLCKVFHISLEQLDFMVNR